MNLMMRNAMPSAMLDNRRKPARVPRPSRPSCTASATKKLLVRRTNVLSVPRCASLWDTPSAKPSGSIAR